MRRILIAVAVGLVTCYAVLALPPQTSDPKSTDAYRVLTLHKIAVAADLVDLTTRYSPGSPLVQSKRFELEMISREIERLLSIDLALVPRLSANYGKLLLKKVDLEVELNSLERVFTAQHPRVTRTRVTIGLLDRETESMLR